MTDEIIQARHLNKKFGDKVVLKDINLTIPKNKVTVVLGPSGSGKSTLIRTFNGLESFDNGDLEIFGQKIDPHDKKAFATIKHEIGMVFQSYDLFPNRTVMQNITLGPLKVQKRDETEVLDQARQLLAEVGLEKFENYYPRQLSGGQKQRVAIVRALILNPKLMLFDEVTASLDPEMVRGVLEILKQLAEQDLTMVVVTHEMNFAKQVADKVIFLDSGEIVEEQDGQKFFQEPQTKRARDFLDSMSF